MSARIRGRLFKFGDNVNSDVIIPGRYLVHVEPEQLARHAFEMLGEDFPGRLLGFDVLVTGENFGCGSAREQAVTALQGLGIQAVVARSFARAFYRNAINRGLPIMECPALFDDVREGDAIEIDLDEGRIKAAGKQYRFPRPPESVRRILEAGGLIAYLRSTMRGTAADR